jgi:hypothetical protein
MSANSSMRCFVAHEFVHRSLAGDARWRCELGTQTGYVETTAAALSRISVDATEPAVLRDLAIGVPAIPRTRARHHFRAGERRGVHHYA